MKKYNKALPILLIVFIFIASITVVPVNAEEKINKRIGSYLYDVATKAVTFIPADSVPVIASEHSFNSIDNTMEFVPQGLTSQPPSMIQPTTVFDEDKWAAINPATGGQYRNTVYLDIRAEKGRYRGTGFMLGPNTVATCGHCIYNTKYGGNNWANSITVTPARAGASNPYGSATSTTMEVGGNWANGADITDDWGIIRLNTNIGNNVGWLGLKTQEASYNGTSVNVNGYPKLYDNAGNEISIMYRAWGTVTSSYNRMLRSTNINNKGGMSGGPMYIYSSKYGYQAIAFTRGETSSYNSYVRIDDWIFNKFKTYINLTA